MVQMLLLNSDNILPSSFRIIGHRKICSYPKREANRNGIELSR